MPHAGPQVQYPNVESGVWRDASFSTAAGKHCLRLTHIIHAHNSDDYSYGFLPVYAVRGEGKVFLEEEPGKLYIEPWPGEMIFIWTAARLDLLVLSWARSGLVSRLCPTSVWGRLQVRGL